MLQLLRAVYPQACLIVEIVSVEEGNYLIRASVEMEGRAIANAFAVSSDLELAQDKALQRLFQILAIVPHPLPELDATPKSQPESDSLTATTKLGNSNSLDLLPQSIASVKSIPTQGDRLPELPKSTLPEGETLPMSEAKLATSNTTIPNIAAIADSSDSVAPKPITELSTSPLPLPSPSRSELLNLTQLEIKRLAWTNKQGSDYLYKKYGKKVRNELTDAELQEFCNYLQSMT